MCATRDAPNGLGSHKQPQRNNYALDSVLLFYIQHNTRNERDIFDKREWGGGRGLIHGEFFFFFFAQIQGHDAI